MKFSVVLLLVQFVLALVAQQPRSSTIDDTYTYMSGSGLEDEDLFPTMDTMTLTSMDIVTPTPTRSMTEAVTTITTTTRMDMITTSNLGATMDTPTFTTSRTKAVYSTDIMTSSQVVMISSQVPDINRSVVHTMITAAVMSSSTTTRSMADMMSSSARARSVVKVNPTATGSAPTRTASTNTTTPTNTKPTVPAPTDSGRSSRITSAGFGIGWIIGFVIGVLLTFVVETSFFLCWRNKGKRIHPSPSGQEGEYFEMSSDMMKQHSEAPHEDIESHTPDFKKPLIEP